MGKDLAENVPAAARVFRDADRIRPGTAAQCFSGGEEELARTDNTQPCLFTLELAAAAALTASGICCDRTAGFSLGEVSALTYAGAVFLERVSSRLPRKLIRSGEKPDSVMAPWSSLRRDVERFAHGMNT
jgi:[acyl-carrier-protein] S-malonyltransferase